MIIDQAKMAAIHKFLKDWPGQEVNREISPLKPVTLGNFKLSDLATIHVNNEQTDFSKFRPKNQVAAIEKASEITSFSDFIGPLLKFFEAASLGTVTISKDKLLKVIEDLGTQLKKFSIQQKILSLVSTLAEKFKGELITEKVITDKEFTLALERGYLEKPIVNLTY